MIKLLLIAVAGAGLLAGCRTDTQSGKEQADIRGRVTSVMPASGAGGDLSRPKGAIRVEGELQPDTRYDKAVMTVTDDTQLYAVSGGKRREITFGDIRTGDSVEATFTGPVRESYPVQVDASHITVIGR